jgi:hypothetical protein
MRMGNLMEGSIFWIGRQTMKEQGLWVRRNSRSVARERYVATPDGYCECGGVIECKNVSYYGRDWWQDGAVPSHYLAQVQLQMHATGRDHAHVWALLGGTEFVDRLVPADPVEQQAIVDAIDAFFIEHLDPRIPPETDDGRLLLTFAHPEGTVIADGAVKDLGDRLAQASGDKADALKTYDTARDMLAGVMARSGVRELINPDWSAKAAPADKDRPDGEWRLTFRRKRNYDR